MPYRTEKQARARMAAAGFAMTTTLVAGLGGVFAVVADAFPWMTVINPSPATQTDASADEAALTMVGDAKATPASRTIQALLDYQPRALTQAGWTAADRSTGVNVLGAGFGCDPKDGIGPVVAGNQNWVRADSDADASSPVLTITAQAYVAGGGAVAFDDLRRTMLGCGAGWDPVKGLGVEAGVAGKGGDQRLVWRRGDVIVAAERSAVPGGSSGSFTAASELMTAMRQSDARLNDLLDGCVDQFSTIKDARRSPYLDRQRFVGFGQEVVVKRPPVSVERTAERLASREGITIYPVPGEPLLLPAQPSVMSTPLPAPTRGPKALPDEVVSPVPPTTPKRPASKDTVLRARADRQGPGCGWDFTAQRVPGFDKDKAAEVFEAAVTAARAEMLEAWESWQAARLRYFGQWRTYTSAAKEYAAYARRMETVTAAWTKIEQARDAYAEALSVYEAALEAREQFKADRKQARREYRDAQRVCRATVSRREGSDPTATASPTASASPTTSATPSSGSTPTVAPSTGSTATPDPQCPPAKPRILDQPVPAKPTSPTPAAEAQLPSS